MNDNATQIAFEVSYEVIRSVDQHPTGPRIRGILASNWIEASDRAKRVYGEGHEGDIQVNSVTTRTERCQRFYHYDRFGRTGQTSW
jgi:hypothetical protein